MTTVSIAGSAAYFSVFGLAQIFTGTFWPVVIMGSALEAGKLIAASFVYRYWTVISKWMATYLILAILMLMIITSTGIFGFLSTGYQTDILPIKIKRQQIVMLTDRKAEFVALKLEDVRLKERMDVDIASLPNNFVTGRIRLDAMYKDEKIQVGKRISEYSDEIRKTTLEISTLKGELIQDQVHIGPIVFIAEVFKTSADEATKWLILMIISAFDPLAVVLTIGVNIAIIRYKTKQHVVVQYEDTNPIGLDTDQQSMLTEIAAQKKITTHLRNPNS